MSLTENIKITETIKRRKSCRTFNQERLTQTDKNALDQFIRLNNKGLNDQTLNLFILEKGAGEKKMKLAYGAVSGHNTYMLGKIKSDPISRLNYGYLMEKIVLKATELGVATCWIGYFDHDYFNDLVTEDGYVVPGLVVTGYAAEKATISEKFIRFTANASQRLPWNLLFFDYLTKAPLSSTLTHSGPQLIKEYAESLEMVRLSPSSSNTQPWRIYFQEQANEFHFFKKPKNLIYEKMGMHELDLGIAMAHFELTSLSNGLTGKWIDHSKEDIDNISNLQYIISWKCLPDNTTKNTNQ